jgi:DNA-binding transcriptional MerR regulator
VAAVDRDRLWRDLALSKTQVARLTGLSRRQIVYWSSKGLIGRPDRKTFDGPSIEKVLLIKLALEQGTRLREAARLAERELDQPA